MGENGTRIEKQKKSTANYRSLSPEIRLLDKLRKNEFIQRKKTGDIYLATKHVTETSTKIKEKIEISVKQRKIRQTIRTNTESFNYPNAWRNAIEEKAAKKRAKTAA